MERVAVGPKGTQREAVPSMGDTWMGTHSGGRAEGLGRGLDVGMRQRGVIW